MSSIRVDSWIWSIRLTKTRSAAAAACRAGHVRVNGVTAKPATSVNVGDEVRVRVAGVERIVEATRLISKRVSPTLAAECYIDNSPPPPPKEILASAPRRDRGAGRPTKRERRELDRLQRGVVGMVAMFAALAVVLTGCSSDDDASSAPTTEETPKAGSGPSFGACGGVSVEEVARITGFANLVETVRNSSVCEWDASVDRTGPVASFNWYRGSPLGREEANVKLSRDITETIEISGHQGFIGYDQAQGICEVGIGFGGDFFEWSVSASSKDVLAALPPIEKVCDAARELSRLSIERAS